MERIGFVFRLAVCAALFSAVAAFAQHSAASAAPIPPAILAAKKVFLSNAGADSGLFPSPFSGDPSRAYVQFYAALKAAGQFELVEDPSEAKANGASDPLPMFRLVIYDRKTHYVLWTLTDSIAWAVGQKNHDRTFDEALSYLHQEFEELAGRVPAAGH